MVRTILAVLLSVAISGAYYTALACPKDARSDCKCKASEPCNCAGDCKCKAGEPCNCAGDCKCKAGEPCNCAGDCKCKAGEPCNCAGDCKCKAGEPCNCKKENGVAGEHACGCEKHEKGECRHESKPDATAAVPKDSIGKEATCPVSGKKFTITANTAFSTYKGETYFFCCPNCKPEFDKEPDKFVKKPDAK